MEQLRIYTIKPGEMDEWITEWRRLIAPIRRKHGFEVRGAWTVDGENEFVWILRYDGPKTWEEADAAYYGSSERTAMQLDPARHIAKAEQRMMHAVDQERKTALPS